MCEKKRILIADDEPGIIRLLRDYFEMQDYQVKEAENGLEVLEEVCPLSARMVVNPVSMKMEHARITELIANLKQELSKEQMS